MRNPLASLLALLFLCYGVWASSFAVAEDALAALSRRSNALPDFTSLVEANGPVVVNISTKQSALYGAAGLRR
jgi:hypothetical protein